MKILHVQHSLRPGGMENGVVNVADILASEGFEFHVACLSSSGEFAARLPQPDLVYPMNKPDGFSWPTVRKLAKLVGGLRPDVIHSHNLGALIYASLGSNFGRTSPILHGEHGTPDDGPSARRRHLQRRLFYKFASRVHTVSSGLYQHFVDLGMDKDKLLTITNGVDTSRFCQGDKKAARQQLGLPEDQPVLLIVGRLIKSKRHLLLFEALEVVSEKLPDVKLLVVGDGGSDQTEIRQAAVESPVSSKIRLEGFKNDLLPYYQASDLLVSPSNVEGLSNALLEGMACGLPSLLADACGNRDVIDDGVNGIIRELESHSHIAESIIKLLKNPKQLKTLGENARAKVEADYSITTMAKAYADTYRSLANHAG